MAMGVHGRPWEVEVPTSGFVKSMGGGGMVEVVEMVEVYLLNKYTRHRPKQKIKLNIKRPTTHHNPPTHFLTSSRIHIKLKVIIFIPGMKVQSQAEH